ncbi:MAG TPA: hypothetical protein VLK65_20800 [Vicinamibacteria bacterium]|nr:hypothetical protein [Vicinamibacteria bacterium]
MNQDQLRAKSLALFHALVSNWANDLRKDVTGLQDELIQKLDALQERMSKYEEHIDEERILAFANEAMASASIEGTAAVPQPEAAADGDALKRLRASLTNIDRGTTLTDVLTQLLQEASQFAPRVALFILKGGSCIGWNGRGFDQTPGFNNEAIKKVSVPSSADTLFSAVIRDRATFHGDSNEHRDNVQLLSRIGSVLPTAVFATPLILRDRIAAIVYADTGDHSVGLGSAEALEILTSYASRLLDALSSQKTGKPDVTPTPPPPVHPRTAPSRSTQVVTDSDPGTGTLSSPDVKMPSVERASSRPSAQAPAPVAKAPEVELDSLDSENRKKHEEAMRFARLLVSEIKLYNESKVREGRVTRDLYNKLRDDIERSRQLYKERVSETIRAATNYFNDELVRILGDGDEAALGHPLPPT